MSRRTITLSVLAAAAIATGSGLAIHGDLGGAAAPAAVSAPTRVDLELPVAPSTDPAAPTSVAAASTSSPAAAVAPSVAPLPVAARTTSAAHVPAPAVTVHAPAAPKVAPRPAPRVAVPAVPVAHGCSGTLVWDGTQCMQPQLPSETDGRAIDCPDGTVGVMVGGSVDCSPGHLTPAQWNAAHGTGPVPQGCGFADPTVPGGWVAIDCPQG